MELLERDSALATLGDAHAEAARGEGRVVFVTGEPGIGKTSLVARFLRDLDSSARVLVGTCDDLSIPRPFGPIRDLAGSVSNDLAEALAREAAPHEIQTLLLAELEQEPHPTVLVLEDVHWADHATLDLIMVIGRRIAALPALLVLTFRGGEAPLGHPLYPTVGSIPADHSAVVELAPLSKDAVASLAGESADEVYAAAGGNPFYVSELLACRDCDEPPASVANAVLGRMSRLEPEARELVELVSVVPNRMRTSLLDAVMPGWPAAAEEPERRQLLEVDATHVRFRHELARNAVRSNIPIATRRRLHGEILDALLAAYADPALIVHHAEAAGAQDVVAGHALVAARRAAALGSNREAYSHYRRAADFIDRRPPEEQAALLEELAGAAYTVNRLDRAFPAMERAIEIHAELDDAAAVGRCARVLARFHWYGGDGDAAWRTALDAVAILEPLGETVELARAYSELSQLAMLAEDFDEAHAWGDRALELALKLGDEPTRAHALVNIGAAKLQFDHRDTGPLLEAHAVADAAGDRHEAARALINLAYTLMTRVVPDAALRYAQWARDYAREHEVHTLASYANTIVGWLQLRAGEWDEAERRTQSEIARGITIPELLAKIVLTELAVRRGDPDAAERIAEMTQQAERTGELQRIAPALELATVSALTFGTPMPTERFEQLVADIGPRAKYSGEGAIRIAAWASVAGVEAKLDQPMSSAHCSMIERDWRGAADAYGEVGWMFDRALMLSLLDDEEALVEAITIGRGLGAEPLVRRVTGRMRGLGLRVPLGPRESTRSNPAGLTARQLEVLRLLGEGLTNAEIAARLVVSPRTAEHHVAAVLTKLGAPSRLEAARQAANFPLSR